MGKDIKQYRNLFENWQRHLMEDEVEDAAEKAGEQLAAAAGEVTELPLALVDTESQKEYEEELEGSEEEELPKPVEDAIVDLSKPISNQISERRFILQRIIREELEALEESSRGGMAAQELVVQWLASRGITGESNIAGSTTPDVVVEGPTYAEFEVKSAKGKSNSNKMQTTFFDKTLSSGHKHEEAKYYVPILGRILEPRIASGKVKLYRKSGKGWETYSSEQAVEVINQLIQNAEQDPSSAQSLVDLALTEVGVDLDKEKNPNCGEYGQLTAPEDPRSYVDLDNVVEWGTLSPAKFGARKKWTGIKSSVQPYAFVDDNDELVYHFVVFEASGTDVDVDAKAKPAGKRKKVGYFVDGGQAKYKIYFLHDGRYYYASADEVTDAVKKKTGIETNKRYFQLTGSKRGASTSGKFSPSCFKIKAKDDVSEASVRDEAIAQLQAHWKPERKEGEPEPQWKGDDYFVVARNVGTGDNPKYDALYVYRTGDSDPLNLGVPKFSDQKDKMQDVGFASYGTPSKSDQVRMKIYSTMEHPDEAKVWPPKESQ